MKQGSVEFAKMDSLVEEIDQATSSGRLFADIDRLSDEIQEGIDSRRQEILDWSLEQKRQEALRSPDLFVLNLLSVDSDEETQKLIAQNINIPSGVVRKMIGNEKMTIPLVINPALPADFLDHISNESASREEFLHFLITSHPNCNSVLREKYEFLRTPEDWSGHRFTRDVASFFTNFDRLPEWVANAFISIGHTDVVIEHLASFTNYNEVVCEISNNCDDDTLKKLLRELEKKSEMSLDNKVASALIAHGKTEWVLSSLDKFPDLIFDADFAVELLKKSRADLVAVSLPKFSYTDPREFVLVLAKNLPSNNYHNRSLFKAIANDSLLSPFLTDKEVAQNVIQNDNFSSHYLLDSLAENAVFDPDIAKSLIKAHLAKYVLDNLNRFPGLKLDMDIATALIEEGGGKLLLENLDSFINLDLRSVFISLLPVFSQGREIERLMEKVDKFQGVVFDNEIALRFIELNCTGSLIKHLDMFSGLSEEPAEKIAERSRGKTDEVFKYLDRFSGLTKKSALIFITNGGGDKVISHIDRFESVDEDVVKALIEAGCGEALVKNIEKFPGVDRLVVANALMAKDEALYSLVSRMEEFPGIDQKKLFFSTLKSVNGSVIARNLEKFTELDFKDHKYIAVALINAGHGQAVADNLDKFVGLDHKEIATMLINSGQGVCIANNIKKFNGVDHMQIALELIKQGWEKDMLFLVNLAEFSNIDHKKFANALLKDGRDGSDYKEPSSDEELVSELSKYHPGYLVEFVDKFEVRDSKKLALDVIQSGYADAILFKLIYEPESFPGLDKEVAMALIPKIQNPKQNFPLIIDSFSGLDKEVAFLLIKYELKEFVSDNKDKFIGLTDKDLSEYGWAEHFGLQRFE